jgi:UDP-N-acetylmuramate--alanine ligase
MKFTPGQHIHFVGIGGSGLSAIARILVERGYKVSGSDRTTNDLTDALARDGATIYHGHDAAHIAGADLLIITSAVKDDHVEVAAAKAAGIPVYKRQDIMAPLMEGQKVIAVAGTKGKTTTTAMIVHILREVGADPSYIVGGVMGNTGTNAGVGNGEWFVVEADEYDNMFLGLRPNIAVITNIEWDHPDCFPTREAMIESFRQFVELLPVGGVLVTWLDDPACAEVARNLIQSRRIPWYYHISDDRDFMKNPVIVAKQVQSESDGSTTFRVHSRNADFRLPLSGHHNVLNALAAYAAVEVSGVVQGFQREDPYAPALATFKATARRFDLRAEIHNIAIIDDYAHNPMSIKAVLEAARMRYPGRAIWAVWQPHTYSRTQALFTDFTQSFAGADHVLITDIYAAREAPIPGVTAESVVGAISHPDVRHTPTFADAIAALKAGVQAPAAVVIMSAGDAPQIGIDYAAWLREQQR